VGLIAPPIPLKKINGDCEKMTCKMIAAITPAARAGAVLTDLAFHLSQQSPIMNKHQNSGPRTQGDFYGD
jgi:hypothetical protein